MDFGKITMSDDWTRWYKKDYPADGEKCFSELFNLIPKHINCVIDFGCASGRNFEAFDGKYHLFGVDIVEGSKIAWKKPFKDLTYIQSKIQDFKMDGSMEHFLCISHGSIMYIKSEEQRKFLQYLIDKGCQNFIFQELDKKTLHKAGWTSELSLYMKLRYLVSDILYGKHEHIWKLGYPFANPFNFEKKWFRPEIPTWVKLETIM